MLKLPPEPHDHELGQSVETSQRRVHMLLVQTLLSQVEHGAPMSSMGIAWHAPLVDFGVELVPVMQIEPPCDDGTHAQLRGQSFALTQPFVQRKKGEVPKHSPDWQSLFCVQPLPRSVCEHDVPPLPPQVLGPKLLPCAKPPLDVPSQHESNPAHASPHD